MIHLFGRGAVPLPLGPDSHRIRDSCHAAGPCPVSTTSPSTGKEKIMMRTPKPRTAGAILLAATVLGSLSVGPAEGAAPKPTLVLVHGAWADSLSWAEVIARLQGEGYAVVAVANPLRSLSGDAAY